MINDVFIPLFLLLLQLPAYKWTLATILLVSLPILHGVKLADGSKPWPLSYVPHLWLQHFFKSNPTRTVFLIIDDTSCYLDIFTIEEAERWNLSLDWLASKSTHRWAKSCTQEGRILVSIQQSFVAIYVSFKDMGFRQLEYIHFNCKLPQKMHFFRRFLRTILLKKTRNFKLLTLKTIFF